MQASAEAGTVRTLVSGLLQVGLWGLGDVLLCTGSSVPHVLAMSMNDTSTATLIC